MYFDTHAHYDDKAFDADRNELLLSLSAEGVDYIINPGCDIPSSELACRIAREYPFVFFAAGIHPEELSDLPNDWISRIEEIASNRKCVAIGEIGLDYYWDASKKELQQQVFEEQLVLASSLDLPVIIHDREAHGDAFEMISRHRENRGVFHCYSGSAEMAEELLKMGWYLGFDGPVTYKNARKAAEVLRITPLERILVETDSPYLSPVPVRGKRNDSRNIRYIIDKIAEVKDLSPEEVASATMQNAFRAFGIQTTERGTGI